MAHFVSWLVAGVTPTPCLAYPIPHRVCRETSENSMNCLPTGNKRTHETVIVISCVYHHAVICLYYAVYCIAIGLQKRLNNTRYAKKTPAAGTIVIYNSAWQGYIYSTFIIITIINTSIH